MAGLFKPQKLGKVFSYANQYIETSFFLFLVPQKSYFIDLNAKQTIEIPLNKTSLINYYTTLVLIGLGILFYVFMIVFGPKYSGNDSSYYLGYLPSVISGLLIICGVISSFIIGKSSRYEIKKRTVFQSVLGINALPEWLSIDTAKYIYEKHKKKLPQNWKEKIINEEYTVDDFFYYYTILSYARRLNPASEDTVLLDRLDQKLHR